MNIRVEEVTENPDGSANAVIYFDNEGLKLLIQYGVLDILTKYSEQNPIPQSEPVKKRRAKAK